MIPCFLVNTINKDGVSEQVPMRAKDPAEACHKVKKLKISKEVLEAVVCSHDEYEQCKANRAPEPSPNRVIPDFDYEPAPRTSGGYRPFAGLKR